MKHLKCFVFVLWNLVHHGHEKWKRGEIYVWI